MISSIKHRLFHKTCKISQPNEPIAHDDNRMVNFMHLKPLDDCLNKFDFKDFPISFKVIEHKKFKM